MADRWVEVGAPNRGSRLANGGARLSRRRSNPCRTPPRLPHVPASPPGGGVCSFPIPLAPMIPLLLLLVARDTTGYWQQQVTYRIAASLDEPVGVLTGHARIAYVNHSPDTLREFFVHQYLDAFRPGSRWAATDAAEGRDRFQHLQDPDYAFERIIAATVMGEVRAPDYPYAPDSTIAHWTLPRPLAPGDSMVVEIDWRARAAARPPRPGRPGGGGGFARGGQSGREAGGGRGEGLGGAVSFK